MRFALCGDDPLALALARAVVSLRGHELTHLVGRPQSQPGMPPFGPGVHYCRSWEELLSAADVDAVIVTGKTEDMQPAVRQLVQAGKAVLLPPELTQPAAFFYELALVEAESPGRIFPLLGLRGHPLVLKLQTLLSQNALGTLRHVQLDRQSMTSHGTTARLLSETDLSQAFLGDVDLLRNLCGVYDQVTASRSGDAGNGYSLASVTLAGTHAPQAVWTAAATSGNDVWRLTVVGDAATAVLEGDPDRPPFRLTLCVGGEPAFREESPSDPGPWLLDKFAASAGAVASTDIQATPARGDAKSISLWGELARAVELIEAVERSVRRRRTIDVYFETPSERGLFKTQMTAAGCSLLVLTLVAVVVYLGTAAAIELPPLLKQILVGLIFLPLGLFLALQLLVFVARPASRDVKP